MQNVHDKKLKALKNILIDESIFVFLTRNDSEFLLKSQLSLFIEKCLIKGFHRQYKAHASYTIKNRLGDGMIYNACIRLLTRNYTNRIRYQKRQGRLHVCNAVVERYIKPSVVNYIPRRWRMMNLFITANENKRESLGRALKPTEVIPLEMCLTALIAHEYQYPIFSFYSDFEHFINSPGMKKPYLEYWNPEIILKNLIP